MSGGPSKISATHLHCGTSLENAAPIRTVPSWILVLHSELWRNSFLCVNWPTPTKEQFLLERGVQQRSSHALSTMIISRAVKLTSPMQLSATVELFLHLAVVHPLLHILPLLNHQIVHDPPVGTLGCHFLLPSPVPSGMQSCKAWYFQTTFKGKKRLGTQDITRHRGMAQARKR